MSVSKGQANKLQVTEDMVREYLVDNGDFLQRNPDLMDHLHIEHASGSAVSLVERQVSVLRERNIDMRRRLNSLMGNARENDVLYERTRSLLLKLLDADSVAALCNAFTVALRDEFEVEHASVILFGEGELEGARMESAASAREQIGSLIRGGRPVCGALREEELGYLFPNAKAMGSAALVPLGDNAKLGLVAIGSSDANRYASDMDTLFLGHIAEVMQRLLARLGAQQTA